MQNLPAEVKEKPFKHQYRTGAAQNNERLTPQQAENATSDGSAQKTLQHTLQTWRGRVKNRKSDSLVDTHWLKTRSDLHVFCSVPQQTTEGDGVRHSSQVNKQNGRQGLNVKSVGEVTDKERRFSLDVKKETTTKPDDKKTDLITG